MPFSDSSDYDARLIIVAASISDHDTAQFTRVAKSSTSFAWGQGKKVTAVVWQVTLEYGWHLMSCSDAVIS